MLRLVAEEWSPIRYHDGRGATPLDQLIPLLNCWRSVVGEDYHPYFDAGVSHVVPKGWTGVIEASGIHLQVTPSGYGNLTPGGRADLDHNIGYMIDAVLRPSIKPAGNASKAIDGYDLNALVSEFCEELIRARRQQILRKYVRQRVVSSTIVGRLSFPAQLYEAIRRPGLFATERNGLDEDIAENRFVKGVLARCRQRVTSQVKAQVDVLLADLEQVSMPADIGRERASIDESRVPASYRRVLELADTILDGRKVGIFGGNFLSKSHIIITSRLFEKFLGLTAALYSRTSGGTCVIQPRGIFLASDGVNKVDRFEIIPDVILRWGSVPGRGLILDTKWKKFEPWRSDFGVQSSDVYQMVSYAARIGLDKCVLLYPWISSHEKPKLIHLGVNLHVRPINIFLVSLPLAEGSVEDSVNLLMAELESVRSWVD